jgi:hypothetical protein
MKIRVFPAIILLIMSVTTLAPLSVMAADESFALSPLIVDEKAKKRDILKQTAVLTNNTERKVTIYVTVKDLDVEEGEQEFVDRHETDVKNSLAHWIEITRAQIELAPGETRRIPYLIQVHLEAEPGLYHAGIFFQEGSNRGEAQQRIKTWHTIDVNIEVQDDANERLQLEKFISDRVFFTGNTASFTYLLENVGNRSLLPEGEIRIFNRKGEEVATLPANTEDVSLLPEATSQLGAIWDAAGKFGRYKAYLDVSYGDKQRGTVNDTVFFWVIPWKQLLFLFTVLAAIVGLLAYMVYDRYNPQHKVRPVVAYVDEDDEQNEPVQQPPVQPRNTPGMAASVVMPRRQGAVQVRTQPTAVAPTQQNTVAQSTPPVSAQMQQKNDYWGKLAGGRVKNVNVPAQRSAVPQGSAVTLRARPKNTPSTDPGAVVSLKKR